MTDINWSLFLFPFQVEFLERQNKERGGRPASFSSSSSKLGPFTSSSLPKNLSIYPSIHPFSGKKPSTNFVAAFFSFHRFFLLLQFSLTTKKQKQNDAWENFTISQKEQDVMLTIKKACSFLHHLVLPRSLTLNPSHWLAFLKSGIRSVLRAITLG